MSPEIVHNRGLECSASRIGFGNERIAVDYTWRIGRIFGNQFVIRRGSGDGKVGQIFRIPVIEKTWGEVIERKMYFCVDREDVVVEIDDNGAFDTIEW